jgi:hypothetical protein
MELDVHSGVQLYMCDRRQCDNLFPYKRCLSILTTCAIWPRDREAEKFRNLKYFEVRNIQEKEPWING